MVGAGSEVWVGVETPRLVAVSQVGPAALMGTVLFICALHICAVAGQRQDCRVGHRTGMRLAVSRRCSWHLDDNLTETLRAVSGPL